jgi:uncharacterized damage-inducible protein DinB
MQLRELFLQQMDRELARSRRALSQVPEGHYDWAPHEKSMKLGYLGELIATMPNWVAMMIRQDELDVAPAEKPPYAPKRTSAELVKAVEEAAEQGRAALAETTDEKLNEYFQLKARGHVVIEAPRHEMIADIYTHLGHHRGQLTVYLRLLGATVPALYGPSADDQRFSLD